MSSKGFEPPLRIEPRVSLWLRGGLVLLYLLIAIGLAFALPPALAGPALAVAAVGFALEWRRAARVPALEWTADDQWWVQGEGPWRLRPATVLTRLLVVLVLDDGRRRCRIALCPDSLPATQWRRLRARLRRQVPAD